MTDEAAGKLRQQAAQLQLKAMTGTPAVAAAHDVAAILPRELAAVVHAELATEAFRERWRRAKVVAASKLTDGPQPPADEDLAVAALLDILAWHGQQAAKVALTYAHKIEGDRRALEGRAAGIAEALQVLSPEKAP